MTAKTVSKTDSKYNVKLIAITAMCAALITVTTAFIKIPSPLGYSHAGDSMIYLAASILPGPFGIIASSIGGALADLISGYPHWAIPTAIIKAVNAVPFVLCRMAMKKRGKDEKIISPSSLLMLIPTTIVTIGDSIADCLEGMGLESVGAPGTTAALAILNDQVKKGGVMASSYVGGLSGAFIPVSEDQGMIDAVNRGALTLEKLEAMTCVCSVGLDMIAIPGDVSATTISGIIADEMAIGMINQKTTAVRIIPVIGKKVGEVVEFGGLLGYAPIMPVNKFECSEFINRGGRIPAPIHSFKN